MLEAKMSFSDKERLYTSFCCGNRFCVSEWQTGLHVSGQLIT